METLRVVAPDIVCEDCPVVIKRELGSMDGIYTVSVDLQTQTIIVEFNPHRTTRGAIAQRLEADGYPIQRQ